MSFKPMKGDDYVADKLVFPYMLSTKIDGMRCVVRDGVAYTSSMKPITNLYIQKMIGRPEYNGLDGELVSGVANAADVFNKTMGDCRRTGGEPDFTFHVFDLTDHPGSAEERFNALCIRARGLPFVEILSMTAVYNSTEMRERLEDRLNDGFEGVMLRSPNSPYKQGRSTVKENFLVKVKPFVDAEAVIIDMTEAQTNTNEKVTNELGRGQRSSAKAGKVAKGTMGSLTVRGVNGRYKDVEFEIGTGFTDKLRAQLWAQGEAAKGQFVTYKYQDIGIYEKPRIPVFKAFRSADEVIT